MRNAKSVFYFIPVCYINTKYMLRKSIDAVRSNMANLSDSQRNRVKFVCKELLLFKKLFTNEQKKKKITWL